jgi:hypothetical protein
MPEFAGYGRGAEEGKRFFIFSLCAQWFKFFFFIRLAARRRTSFQLRKLNESALLLRRSLAFFGKECYIAARNGRDTEKPFSVHTAAAAESLVMRKRYARGSLCHTHVPLPQKRFDTVGGAMKYKNLPTGDTEYTEKEKKFTAGFEKRMNFYRTGACKK